MSVDALKTALEIRHLERAGLNLRQQRMVEERVADCLARLEGLTGTKLAIPLIRFDLAGTCAGQYQRQRRLHCLRFNPYLLARHLSESLHSTVPHEVAHYAAALLHPRRRIRPHGPQWQRLMSLLCAAPDRTHRFDLTDIPTRQQRRWSYRCSCSTHDLTTTRHKRALGGTRYFCRKCGEPLILVTEPPGPESSTA